LCFLRVLRAFAFQNFAAAVGIYLIYEDTLYPGYDEEIHEVYVFGVTPRR